MLNEYVLYKGEDIIAEGTAKEIADKLGIKEETVFFYGRPCYAKKDKGNRRILVRVYEGVKAQ